MAEEETDNTEETTETPVEAEPEMSDTAVDETPTEKPAEAAEPEADPTPPQQSEPKKKGKRLPRSARPQKTRPKRERATTRKPISREEKPEHERGRRQERRGVVVSDAMDKTIVVKVDAVRSHPKYKKVIRRSIKFHAHDEQNRAHVGDVVRIVETRPISKTKHWRLAEIVEVAK
jgi:small subunit ribosomal protein S17